MESGPVTWHRWPSLQCCFFSSPVLLPACRPGAHRASTPCTCSVDKENMMHRVALICCGLSLCAAILLSAQPQNTVDPLPRRGWFGVALAPHASGAVVTSVADGSSAAAEGIRAGDVIRAVDD